jgi:crotonobetainyl-CoA:carnitine CoA-transferase CaiB-like acyl-CoA transferase
MGGSGSVNFIMEQANRGKRSVGINIASPEGLELLYRLARTADVFLTNFLPDARQRLKIDVEHLQAQNPSIIYVRGSGQGPKGPDAGKAGYDGTAYWARGAVADSLTPPDRDWPIEATAAVGDLPGGMTLAGGIAAALFARERTGRATVVDVSLFNTALWSMAPGIVASRLYGVQRQPHIRRERSSNPISILYKTKDDRFLKLSMLESDRWWADLCDHLGHPELVDDPRFADAGLRARNSRACVLALDAAFAEHTLDEWRQRFETLAGAWGPVQTAAEVHSDPQALENGYLPEVTAPDGTTFAVVGAPVQFDEEPIAVRGPCPAHAEHTDEVLLEFGLTWDDLIELKTTGAIS